VKIAILIKGAADPLSPERMVFTPPFVMGFSLVARRIPRAYPSKVPFSKVVCWVSLALVHLVCPLLAEPLRTISAVKTLPLAEVLKRPEVDITATITHFARSSLGAVSDVMAQDATDGIFVFFKAGCSGLSGLRLGSRVRLKGLVERGFFAPTLQVSQLEDLGPVELPEPTRPGYLNFHDGQEDGRFIVCDGVAQQVEPLAGMDPPRHRIKLMTPSGPIFAILADGGLEAARALINAEVSIRGVAASVFTIRRTHVYSILWTHDMKAITVISPSTAPEDMALVDLFTHLPGRDLRRQLRVRGTVAAQMNANTLYLHEAGAALQVELDTPRNVPVGSYVTLHGFLSMAGKDRALHHAEIILLETGQAPEPMPLTFKNFGKDAAWYHNQLTRAEGALLAVSEVGGERRLLVEGPFGPFTATQPVTPQDAELLVGSQVAVTGICRVDMSNLQDYLPKRRFEDFQIFPRGPEDLVTLRPGPWWRSKRAPWQAGSAVGALALASGAGWWRSRRKYRRQRAAREAAQGQFSAVLEERGRLARELHDSLTQSLTAISIHIEALRLREQNLTEEALPHLNAASEAVCLALDDARRAVRGMKSQALEGSSLAEAIGRVATSLSGQITGCVIGEASPWPDMVENALLRVAQEGLTNAVRHAKTAAIRWELAYTKGRVCLRVLDEGAGFDPQSAMPATSGGFGLGGLRDRVQALGGEFSLLTSPGNGVTLQAAFIQT
jgi:signal transduction histidine kinase